MTRKEWKRSLQNFLEIADELGIDVYFCDPKVMKERFPSVGGFFHPHGRFIMLLEGLPNWKTVYFLAHELGHAAEYSLLEDDRDYIKDYSKRYEASCKAMSGPNATARPLREFLYEREVFAFDYADELIQEFSIKIPKTLMRKQRKKSLWAARRDLELTSKSLRQPK